GDITGDGSTGGGPTPVWFAVREPAYTVIPLTDAAGATRLTDAMGRSLYYFTLDTVGSPPASACGGSAGPRPTGVGHWPPRSAAAITVPSHLDGTRFSTFTRADNLQQTAFDGHPLYYFADDTTPGDVRGLSFGPGAGHWFTIDPARAMAPTMMLATGAGPP